jgi:hypothetical protein
MLHRLPVFLVLLVSLSAIYSSAAYYADSKASAQPFMELGLYANRGLQGYIPNSNFTITPPQTTNWTITVGNMMTLAQFVRVFVLLGNSSNTLSANSTRPASDTIPELAAMELFLGVGETSKLDFSWTVQSTNETTDGRVSLNLVINGQAVSGQQQVRACGGRNFRLIFELWTLNASTGSFQYGYPGMDGTVGEWVQVWFNVIPNDPNIIC